MFIIAIDCGASFIKASRFNTESKTFEAIEIRKTPEADGRISRIEKTVQIIKDLIEMLVYENEEVLVGLSTEMHGFLIANNQGIPLTDYISWKDERGNEMLGKNSFVQEIRNLLDIESVTLTGMPIKVGLPSVNLFYQLKNDLSNQKKADMYFYTLGDYIIRILSGQEPYIHVTNAAATGLYDIISNTWNEQILNKLGMQEIHFPKITKKSTYIRCELCRRNILFYPAIGDQQAALLGSDFWSEKSISLNFGTGAQLSIVRKEINLSNQYQTRPYFNNSFLYTIPHIPSGRALNVYFNFVSSIISEFASVNENEIWEFISKEVEKDLFCSLDIDMSFFSNAVTKNLSGYIGNIEENTFTIGNLFHSIYKRMAINTKKMVEYLHIEEIDTIIFSGGVVKKNYILRDLLLKEFNIEKYIIAENETLKGICKYIVEELML